MSATVFPRVRLSNFMFNTPLTFDKLPEAVVYLTELVTRLQGELRELRNSLAPPADKDASPFISTKEACALLGECKNTLYAKVRSGIIPAYKSPGSKSWRFIKSELMAYMKSGRRKSQAEVYDEMVAEMSKGLRPGGRNKLGQCL